jgi:hypothetical protein
MMSGRLDRSLRPRFWGLSSVSGPDSTASRMYPFAIILAVWFARATIALMDISAGPGDTVRMMASLCDAAESTSPFRASMGFD